MSRRESPAPDANAARRAADEVRHKPPVSTDPQFGAVRRASTGAPAIVSDPDGAPAFWIVPYALDDRACGFARVDLQGRVGQVVTFGGGPDDRASWLALAFFAEPPRPSLEEARSRYPGLRAPAATLSYDGNPSKWGWRIDADQDALTIFVTPGGWYTCGSGRTSDPMREG